MNGLNSLLSGLLDFFGSMDTKMQDDSTHIGKSTITPNMNTTTEETTTTKTTVATTSSGAKIGLNSFVFGILAFF